MLLLTSINMGNYPIQHKPNKDSAVHIILLSILKHHDLSMHWGGGTSKGLGLLLDPGENMILQDRNELAGSFSWEIMWDEKYKQVQNVCLRKINEYIWIEIEGHELEAIPSWH